MKKTALGLPVAPATPIAKLNTTGEKVPSSPTHSSASESVSVASSPSHSPTQPTRYTAGKGRGQLHPSSPTQSTAKHKGIAANKEDKPPARGSSARRGSQAASGKGQQGKITDFISPSGKQVLANKNNKHNAKSQQAASSSRDSSASSAQELTSQDKPRGRGRAPTKVAAGSIGSMIRKSRKASPRNAQPSSSEDEASEEEEEEDEEDEEEEEEEQMEEEEEEEESEPPSPAPKKGRGRPPAGKQYVQYTCRRMYFSLSFRSGGVN